MYDFMNKSWLIMNMTSAARLKTVSRGQEKAGKVSDTKKKQHGFIVEESGWWPACSTGIL